MKIGGPHWDLRIGTSSFEINLPLKNAKMCIFAQKRQPLLNAGKDRCLTFKFALLSHLGVECVVSLIFNFELSLHLNLL